MGALCNNCGRDVATARDVRGCSTCHANGTAAGIHARFRDDDTIEEVIKDWNNPPFVTHAQIAADQAATQEVQQAPNDAVYTEAEEIAQDIELAAAVLVENPDGPDTLESLVEKLHGEHPSIAPEFLSTRIATRVQEMHGLIEAERIRFDQDVRDRAAKVAAGEQALEEAIAVVTLGYPGRDEAKVREAMLAAVEAATAPNAGVASDGGGDGELGAGSDAPEIGPNEAPGT